LLNLVTNLPVSRVGAQGRLRQRAGRCVCPFLAGSSVARVTQERVSRRLPKEDRHQGGVDLGDRGAQRGVRREHRVDQVGQLRNDSGARDAEDRPDAHDRQPARHGRRAEAIHESSYADGMSTRWSSQRVEPDDFRGESLLLTGEHLFPWHFGDSTDLHPYREVAAILAEQP
jgi:hypothetical protein